MLVKYETASYIYFCELSISSLSHCFHNRPKIQTTLVYSKKCLIKKEQPKINNPETLAILGTGHRTKRKKYNSEH